MKSMTVTRYQVRKICKTNVFYQNKTKNGGAVWDYYRLSGYLRYQIIRGRGFSKAIMENPRR